jgi:hypothetical protein
MSLREAATKVIWSLLVFVSIPSDTVPAYKARETPFYSFV